MSDLKSSYEHGLGPASSPMTAAQDRAGEIADEIHNAICKSPHPFTETDRIIRDALTAAREEGKREGLGSIESIIKAWESLPAGRYSAQEIGRWLADVMAPAINVARSLAAKEKMGVIETEADDPKMEE